MCGYANGGAGEEKSVKAWPRYRNFPTTGGEVEVANSSASATIDDDANRLFDPQLAKRLVRYPEQHNPHECGLFAIACVVDSAHNVESLMDSPSDTNSAAVRLYFQ